VDIEFSNNIDPDVGSPFTVGNLVTMTLTVPANWTGPNSVVLSVNPDEFSNGIVGGQLVIVPTTAGPNFTLNIVTPEPGSLSLAGLSLGAILLRRRRRTSAVHGR